MLDAAGGLGSRHDSRGRKGILMPRLRHKHRLRRDAGFTLIELLIYSAHCGGLPDHISSATTCPIANGQSGAFPVVLTTQQTNSANRVGGPFINTMPTMPQGWTGSGTSYKYISTASGVFVVCATGDGTGADSNGGSTCP
jgi:hypothetical protein